jgi:hypothetical protein
VSRIYATHKARKLLTTVPDVCTEAHESNQQIDGRLAAAVARFVRKWVRADTYIAVQLWQAAAGISAYNSPKLGGKLFRSSFSPAIVSVALL